MNDPEEKSKIMRVRGELHGSGPLTDVEHDNKEFEITSNEHLNAHMNKQIRIDNRAVERKKMNSKLADLKTIMNGLGTLPSVKKKDKEAHSTEAKFDRFKKKEFSRRKIGYVPQLINDNYANFRF